MVDIEKLSEYSRLVRQDCIKMTSQAGSGHLTSALSCTDLLVYLFFNKARYDSENPAWPERDRIVLSKGHGCPALYSCLAHAGFYNLDKLFTLRKLGSKFQGHPSTVFLPEAEVSTGALGHGIAAAAGMAAAGKMDLKEYRVYAIIGDGECNEGEVWEAAMFAAHYALDNFTVFLDRNWLQLDGFTEEIVRLEPLEEKWKAFGWHVQRINGHDFTQISTAVEEALKVKGRPQVIIADTVKGKGVPEIENKAGWHGKALSAEAAELAVKALQT